MFLFFISFTLPKAAMNMASAVGRPLTTTVNKVLLTHTSLETTQPLDLGRVDALSCLHGRLWSFPILFWQINWVVCFWLLLWTRGVAVAVCRPHRTNSVGLRQRVAGVVPTLLCGTTCCHTPCAACLWTFCSSKHRMCPRQQGNCTAGGVQPAGGKMKSQNWSQKIQHHT